VLGGKELAMEFNHEDRRLSLNPVIEPDTYLSSNGRFVTRIIV
jgi:hypothetical protein